MLGTSSAIFGSSSRTFRGTVSVTNTAPTDATLQTPVWFGVHDGTFDTYNRNEPLNPNFSFMESLVEDGSTGAIVAAFGADSGGLVDGVVVNMESPGPIAPGETVSVSFEANVDNDKDYYFSYASMVIPSNDAFLSNGNPMAHKIFDYGNFIGSELRIETTGAMVLDGATEVNDEIPANTAAFGQSMPNTGVTEGTVTLHPGFMTGGNILAARTGANFLAPGYVAMTIEATEMASTMDETTIRFTITIPSNTDGTFQTPVWLGIHNGMFDLYDRNAPLPEFMIPLVEDGDTSPVTTAFAESGFGIWDGTVGSAPLMPGAVETVDVTVPNTANQYLSYASMVLPSNDAFVANGNPIAFEIFDSSGNFVPVTIQSLGTNVLDGGSEVNDEVLENTAGLMQTVPGTGQDENAVRLHEGFIMEPRRILESFPNGQFTDMGYETVMISVATRVVAMPMAGTFYGTVTVQSLAPNPGGTCQTPVWVGIHDGGFDLYNRNEPIVPTFSFMEALIEDGNNAPVIAAFNEGGMGRAWDGVVGMAPICPGQSATLDFMFPTSRLTAGSTFYFSYASMVLPSNDAFIANGNPTVHPIFDASGNFVPVSFNVGGNEVLDGGTEDNDEQPINTAFFGQVRPNTGTTTSDNVVLHPGFITEPRRILEARPAADFTDAGYRTMDIVVTGEFENNKICFADTATLNVQGQGRTPMNEVKVGDVVQTGPSKWERVYSFAKRDSTRRHKFIQIHTNDADPLELSDNHFLYLASGESVQAGLIKVGDTIMGGGVVQKVSKVSRKGYYSPLVYSGKLVVNGNIVASSFAYDSQNLEVGSLKMPVSGADWMHFSQAPHRLICKLMFETVCTNEEYLNDGMSHVFAWQIPIYEWWLSLGTVASVVFFGFMALFLVGCSLLEFFVDNPVALVAGSTMFALYRRSRHVGKTV